MNSTIKSTSTLPLLEGNKSSPITREENPRGSEKCDLALKRLEEVKDAGYETTTKKLPFMSVDPTGTTTSSYMHDLRLPGYSNFLILLTLCILYILNY